MIQSVGLVYARKVAGAFGDEVCRDGATVVDRVGGVECIFLADRYRTETGSRRLLGTGRPLACS